MDSRRSDGHIVLRLVDGRLTCLFCLLQVHGADETRWLGEGVRQRPHARGERYEPVLRINEGADNMSSL